MTISVCRSAARMPLCVAWALLFPFPCATSAQVGLQGGVSLSTFEANVSGSVTTRLGLTVGAFVDVPVAHRIVFRPTLTYTQRGGQTSEFQAVGNPPLPFTYTRDWRMDHVQFVALASIDPGSEPGGQPARILLGTIVSHQVRASAEREDGLSRDVSDFRETSLGLTGGLAIERERLRFELRYEILSQTMYSRMLHHYGALQVGYRIS